MAERTLTPSVPSLETRQASGEAGGALSGRRHSGFALLPLVPLGLFLVLVVAGPFFSANPQEQDLGARLQPPVFLDGSWDRPLGTDGLGRDILSRVLVGARLSLIVGALAAILSAGTGVMLGLLAGSLGGWFDTVTTALVEVALSIPTIVTGIVFVSTLGQSMPNLLLILVISGWVGFSRVVRLQARTLVRSDFALASMAMGSRRRRVAFVHVLPNVMPQVIVLFCQYVAVVMIWEASLTYLGIGLPIERISLGGMIREGQQQVFDGWWISAIPGFAIALAVIGFNLLADWLQSELDPVQGGNRWRRVRRYAGRGSFDEDA